jgi:F-type H+-transporting ATPase subunit b
VRFASDPSVAPGLTLQLGGAHVGWTVDSYLDGLDALLEDRAGRAITRRSTDAA